MGITRSININDIVFTSVYCNNWINTGVYLVYACFFIIIYRDNK
jgi:hypothetical protein